MEDDKKIIIKFIIHHSLMTIFAIIIIAAIGYAYYAINIKKNDVIKMPVSKQSKGAAHPLPDFIIDKIKPDELEQLKP